jgi:hypothetical protein
MRNVKNGAMAHAMAARFEREPFASSASYRIKLKQWHLPTDEIA